RTPFDQKELAQAGVDRMRKMIRELEPVRPSTRIDSLQGEERTTTARRRRADAPRLVHLLRGDLDWIVMKCLEKDRTRRYETANGLVMDLQRYRNSEPIVARPPSKYYRIQKTVRRNKLAFAAAAAVLGALVAGLALATFSFVREREARRSALAAASAAQVEAHKREQMAKFLQDMLARVSSQVAQNRDTTKLKEILGQVMTRFAPDLKNQPSVEAELRAVQGSILNDLGDLPAAVAMNEEPLRLFESAGDKETLGTAVLLQNLGDILGDLGELERGIAAAKAALALQKKLKGENSAEYAEPLNTLGLLFWNARELPEAEKTL